MNSQQVIAWTGDFCGAKWHHLDNRIKWVKSIFYFFLQIYGFVQDCGISSVLTMEILQSGNQISIWTEICSLVQGSNISPVNSLRPSDAYMRQWSNQHWFRQWLVACSAPSHYQNQCWNIVNKTLRNKLQWIFSRNSNIFIQENAFESVVCEKVAILSRPQWVNSLWPSDAISSHCLNQYWLIINGFCDIHMTVISQEILMISICKMSLKITFLKLLQNFPRANELTHCRYNNLTLSDQNKT